MILCIFNGTGLLRPVISKFNKKLEIGLSWYNYKGVCIKAVTKIKFIYKLYRPAFLQVFENKLYGTFFKLPDN